MLKALSISFLVISVFALSLASTLAQSTLLGTTDVTSPVLKSLVPDQIGGFYLITTTIVGSEDVEKQFAVIIEVRDETGVTVYLQFQIGRVIANGQTEVGTSWLPAKAGKYELRAFAISNFTSPMILTSVRTSQAVIP